MADKSTNLKYGYMRSTHKHSNGQANGYRSHNFFLREQKLVTRLLDRKKSPILDLACGSGIMLLPLLTNPNVDIFGLDYNEDACIGTRSNQINALRGDAFCLPLRENSIGQIINCQFLNQQTKNNASLFINEIARVLQPGGQAIIVWRNSRSLIHKVSHFLLSIFDFIKRVPIFPQYCHSIDELKHYSDTNGLIILFEAVSLPFGSYHHVKSSNLFANIFGASNVLVIKKPQIISSS